MATLLVTHPCFVEHDTGPGHPERPDRMRVLDPALAPERAEEPPFRQKLARDNPVLRHWQALPREQFKPLVRREAPLIADVEEWIARVHPYQYVEAVKAARPGPDDEAVRLDPDTVLSPTSWEPALRAVGAGLLAVDEVIAGRVQNAFCQVRPCGHHAETARAMGFCIFNNIAVAARYAQKKHGAERIAIVDFDVHHGNGTQDIFYADKSIYFASTHQMPLYPGTGALSETGVGNIWNAPLRPGDGGSSFKEAFEARILPSLRNFAPDLVLISAGFDAHEADPLANLRLLEDDFAWATGKLADIAHKHSGGRIVSMLEGGYDLAALANSVSLHVAGLMDAGR
ncbi:MAG TPA: histone deacetylase family protein [Hyphomicrobiaceae bacterium]|nr:histone deacetylase family protein [Hyphomicrobiaceae bacterium]